MKNGYTPTIGLEVHAELRTHTKMFCHSKNDTDESRPNVNICPVCLGYPGSLPTINKEAVRQVLRFGVAVNGTLADYTEFDRKNYFYPDIPKGYQISQYKFPLVSGGELAGVQLTRVHLEEDTAKSSHDTGDQSLLDFNRAGVPLMELVTEPVIHDAESASRFAKELQLLLVTLGASFANMEKGEMRVEANISVSKTEALGTKVEVKNLNSFRAVERAIRYEVDRHIELLEKGEKVVQETRGWDENREVTFSQRAKEDSHDYRYFPDPDLPKLVISDMPEFSKEVLQSTLPELPWVKRERLQEVFGLKKEDAEVFVYDTSLLGFLEGVLPDGAVVPATLKASTINFILSDLVGLLKNIVGATLPSPKYFRELMDMKDRNEVTTRNAKDILAFMVLEDTGPRALMEKHGLNQQTDTAALKTIVETIIKENEKVVQEYKGGKLSSLQFLLGQAMRVTKGSADPGSLKTLFEELLN